MTRVINYRWQSDAACKGIPVSMFYPERGRPVPDTVRTVCKDCPVKRDCLEHGLHYEKYGVWGGMTEDQRQVIRRERKIRVRTPEILSNISERELANILQERVKNSKKYSNCQ